MKKQVGVKSSEVTSLDRQSLQRLQAKRESKDAIVLS